MATRAVLGSFERYQKERVAFVRSVERMAKTSQNVEVLYQAGVMQLLRPLLLDSVPSIQQSAALALGRLAHHNAELAEAVVSNHILPQLVHCLRNQHRRHKTSAAFCVHAVSRHSIALAIAVANAGALEPLVECLENFDPEVKESAACALGSVASHTAELAEKVARMGAVQQLVLCCQESDVSLQRTAAKTLGELAKHSSEQAQAVVDSGAVAYLAPMVQNRDVNVKRQVCLALSQVAKHSIDLAEAVVEADVFPKALTCLRVPDDAVKSAAAHLVREVVKHSCDLAQVVISAGGAALIVKHINESAVSSSLPGIIALGYMCAASETMALTVISENALSPMICVVREDCQDHLKAAAVWTLGQMGKHSAVHANRVTECLVPLAMCEADLQATEELRSKARRTLKMITSKLTSINALDSLVQHDLPEAVMRCVLQQLAKVLSTDQPGRRSFVQSGGLARLQTFAELSEGRLQDAVASVCCLFADEIVQYYSPCYTQHLMQKLDTSVSPAGRT